MFRNTDAYFELSLDLLCVASFDGYFLDLNPAFGNTLGWSLEELRSKRFVDFVHPDDQAATVEATKRLGSGGTVIDFENRYVCKDGGYRWLSWRATADIKNKVIVAAARDVTEERSAQRRLQVCLSAVTMGVWEWDIDTNELHFDDNMYRLYGISKGDFPGPIEAWQAIIHPEDRELFLRQVEEATTEKKTLDAQFRILLPTGEIRHIGTKGHFEKTVGKEAVKMLGVNWDITKLMEQEAALHEMAAKTISSAKMSSLGEMAAGIAHEINNPLTAIYGQAEDLRELATEEKLDQETVGKVAAKIEATTERISRIIKGLRTFSRDASEDPFVATRLGQLVQDTLSFCRERFVSHGVQLQLGPISPSLELYCRPAQISEILLNLLNNAFDAVQDLKEKRIRIELSDRGSNVEIVVSDNGPGISKDVREKIFVPFYTTKPVGKGTGLGLAIALGIAQAHQGKLEMEEAPGGGALFRLTLPQHPS